jgi:hypothetical protein
MLDNLNNQEASIFSQDDEKDKSDYFMERRKFRLSEFFSGRFFGMEPTQLFILSLMLLVVVFLLGTVILLLSGRIMVSSL